MSKVWEDAYYEYALRKGFFQSPDYSEGMSGEDRIDYIFSEVEKRNLNEEFETFVRKYCMQYK